MKIICLYGVCVLHLYTLNENIMTQIKLGTTVRVSDPCYTNDVWCKTQLTNVKAGDYAVRVEHSDEGGWGNRVAKLEVIHMDFGHLRHDEFNWRYHSEIGVDSGQAGIFCESSYRNDELAKDIVTPQGSWIGLPMIQPQDGDVFYDKMCTFTINGEGQWGSYDSGVVTSSGFGDGGYPLDIIKNKEGEIVAMRVTYIGFEDEDGEICGECGGDMEDGECEHCQHEINER